MSASDHLANERTFLAWLRTAISLLGFGILIAKLRFLESGMGLGHNAGVRSTRLGLAFAAGGLLTLMLFTWQYYRTKLMLDSGSYKRLNSAAPVFGHILIARRNQWIILGFVLFHVVN